MRYLLLLLSVASFTANAEINKDGVICKESGQICFYWWPALPAVEGWKQDKDASYNYSMNAQAPSGSSFAKADTVIYAKAIYKPSQPESKDLESFTQNDQATSRKRNHSLIIDSLPSVRTQGGQVMKRFSFTPGGKGNWEQVAYGEEKDKDGNEYFLTFVVSSRTKTGLANNIKAYEQFISNYK